MSEISVLIISNNILGKNSNNGKTLYSIFKKFNSNEISQIYFSEEIKTINKNYKYYKISDQDMVKKTFLKNFLFKRTHKQNTPNYNDNRIKSKGEFARIIREFFWKKKYWETQELNSFIKAIKPDILFFVAGDSNFSYKITKHLKIQTGAKLVIYITDDYFLPRINFNLFWWIRWLTRRKHFNWAKNNAELIYTISPFMRKRYSEKFNIESKTLANSTSHYDDLKRNQTNTLNKKKIKIVYAGGLHYGRFNSIIAFANSIKKLNQTGKIFIDVYTFDIINPKKMKGLEQIITLKGGVDSKKLDDIYFKADFLLHVESFHKKHISQTRYSLSTKIPEYINARRTIIAVGPKNISSINFLEEISLIASNKKEIYDIIKKIIDENFFPDELIEKAKLKLESNYKKMDMRNDFIKLISKIDSR